MEKQRQCDDIERGLKRLDQTKVEWKFRALITVWAPCRASQQLQQTQLGSVTPRTDKSALPKGDVKVSQKPV